MVRCFLAFISHFLASNIRRKLKGIEDWWKLEYVKKNLRKTDQFPTKTGEAENEIGRIILLRLNSRNTLMIVDISVINIDIFRLFYQSIYELKL